ncbi:GNAT family N-acetyltransferase [Erysipelotrichaceae bacterium OttesenSCG-928-M19]|nr:GNAT family N-acetyltransferase [Erysipelotrichaceae bacterium OttesenSCG-928-M19]
MEFIKITNANIDNENFGCALSNQEETMLKRDWLKDNLDKGYTFVKLNARGKVFIEYVPAKYAWAPIKADNYLFIDCFWVSGKYKKQGIGKELLNKCLTQARDEGYDGVVAITSNKKKPFLSDPTFYKKQGFKVVDSLDPYYELVCYMFDESYEKPSFIKNQQDYVLDEGITIVYSNHCPWTKLYASKLIAIAENNKIATKLIQLNSYQEAQKMSNPFTSYAFYDDGNFITNEIFSEKKLEKYLNEKR